MKNLPLLSCYRTQYVLKKILQNKHKYAPTINAMWGSLIAVPARGFKWLHSSPTITQPTPLSDQGHITFSAVRCAGVL